MTAALLSPEAQRSHDVERLTAGGFVLVPVPKGTKGPAVKGWNTDPAHFIRTPGAARAYLGAHPGAGVGLLHSESQTAALDVDSEYAAQALAAVGVDLAALLAAPGPKVRGRRGVKPLYRVPDGLSLKPHALGWPDPSRKKGPGGRVVNVTLFELRAGPVQDVMPPSIHPDTGQPYTWEGAAPDSLADLPELPPELLSLWQRWGVLEPVMKAACPWAPAEVAPPSAQRVSTPSGAGGESVVNIFNTSRTPGEMLNLQGYSGPERGPWLYPGSASGHAGVRMLPGLTPEGHAAVYSHHAADPLGDGIPRDAFGIWALLEHGVDVGRAQPDAVREVVKAAARFLGLPVPERGSAGGAGKSTPPARNLPGVDWGEVRPLPPFTEPVPGLPSELLPRPLAAWIEDEARAAGLPLEMIAGPVVVGAGGLIGHRLTLRNTPNAPAVPGNLWGAVCGPPSTRKTHAVEVGMRALNRAQRAEFERLEAERPSLETARDMAAARLEGLTGTMKRAAKGGKNPPPMPDEDELTEAREALNAAEAALRPRRWVVNEPTIEKLGEIMRDNPQGVILYRDELTAWLSSFDRAGREADRGFWLEAANGTGSLTVDRLARGTVFIPRVCAGVLGSIQPGPLADLLDAQRGAGDGLLQRFQVFIYPDTFPPFDQAAQRQPLDVQEGERAGAVLDALPGLTLELLGSIHPSGDGAPLIYSPEAQMVYDVWEVDHAAQVRDMSRGEAYRAHLGKLPSTFARLALIFHALSVVEVGVDRHPNPAQVGEESALLAALWCAALIPHARKLWGEGRRRDVLDAREVLRFIERGSVRDAQKVSEVRAALAQGKAGMTGPRLAAALELLEACGAVRVDKLPPAGERGGRPSPLLRIHPQALDAQEPEGGEA
ncbi:DUF3987 domain-containing protein [Deinococcus arenicola]|uniref:DUF3987 domain-containing protein n=1 Tax=Deinococcus arenicola TaxID=2994950 RepID=A0ABU4DUN5_9DEIO|nr:DUF3987 domain-containing protein [Deinococcus sp. ZS9-10]MDV6376093.1 DUF3987 domain-containing protein [Deinococcus sp. ZS9-10]